MNGLRESLGVAWDAWRADRGGAGAVADRRKRRLEELIAFAHERSSFYSELYNGIAANGADLGALPPVKKRDLMANFDRWVTDPAATRTGVEAFIADKTNIGRLYLGRYAVWTTSGSTGRPAIILQDEHALAVYTGVGAVRGSRQVGLRRLLAIVLAGVRIAAIVATGSHFAAAASIRRWHTRYPWLKTRVRVFPVTAPIAELVDAVNAFRPALLFGYPTAIWLLAEEQAAGRLRIHPLLVRTGAEWLAPAARRRIAAVFNCPVFDIYGASEGPPVALDCGRGSLHVNEDWFIIEPVNRDLEPVAPGEASYTLLFTNLANRIQPFIRYDLGDSVTRVPEPCSCGSPLAVIRVEGRRDDILYMKTGGGAVIAILPGAVATVVEETSGVQRFQVIQTGPATLSVRLEVAQGTQASEVREAVSRKLREYLLTQGLSSVVIEYAAEPPHRDPTSGKFRQVWSAVESGRA